MTIRGIPVTYINKRETGKDALNRPIYEEEPETVDNVLVAPASTDDIVNTSTLTGKKAVYTLGIPKGDTHEWEDAEVEFFGRRWHCFGFVLCGIEEMVPLDWNGKVQVEAYG